MLIDCSLVEEQYLQIARERNESSTPTLALTYPRNNKAARAYVDAILIKSKGISTVTSYAVSSEEDIREYLSDWNRNSPQGDPLYGILIISPPSTLINPHSLIVDSKNVEGNDFDDRLDRVSCTARSIVAIISHALSKEESSKPEELLEGKNVVIIGYGKSVGKPLSYLLMRHHVGSVTTIHKYTNEYIAARRLFTSDIIVSATGNPSVFPSLADLSFFDIKNKIIIDAGISKVKGRIVGDIPLSFAANNEVSPVPGGVGAVTTAMILANTTLASRGLLT